MPKNNKYSDPVLQARNISKEFSGVYALQHVDLEVYSGEVLAIIGENGAGKSTLMKIVSGVYGDYTGDIIYKGRKVRYNNPREASDDGIAIIHQELNLVPHLSITENLFLGNEIVNKLGFLDKPKMTRKAKDLLHRLHLDINPDTLISHLRVGQQQLVEIAKALLLESEVLIMDEPTSSISDHEVDLLFKIIAELTTRGVAVVYISHKLNELFEIANSYTVLRDGNLISSGSMQETSRNQLIQNMVGRDTKIAFTKANYTQAKEVLRVENLRFRNPENPGNYLVDGVNFSLRKGEVLGVCGLMGAGRTELLEAVFGLSSEYVSGEIYIEERLTKINRVWDAVSAGIGLVPEDRKLQGLVLNMDIMKNTSMASLKNISDFNFINKTKERDLCLKYTDKLKTKASGPSMEVSKLSGGNQQKVVIAKWLATHPKVLLLDEPTRGIDIGAKTEIYKLIAELAEQGLGIVVVSSELPEILALSDRILVMSESKQTALMSREEATEEKIMQAAISEKE